MLCVKRNLTGNLLVVGCLLASFFFGENAAYDVSCTVSTFYQKIYSGAYMHNIAESGGIIGYADQTLNQVMMSMPPSGAPTVAAYSGSTTYGGDGSGVVLGGGLPYSICVSTAAPTAFYAVEKERHIMRKIVYFGNIDTIAGTNAIEGSSGINGAATSAQISSPTYCAVDTVATVYFSETNGIKKITGGVLSLVAGTGTKVSAGDGGDATSASFVAPYGLWLDSVSSLYVTDSGAFTVRRIALGTGAITLFAGASGANYGAKFLGGGGLAVNAQLPIKPFAVGDPSGNMFISGDSVVLRVEVGTNIIKQIAGTTITTNVTENRGFGTTNSATVDGLTAKFNGIESLTWASSGQLMAADTLNNRVRVFAFTQLSVAPSGAPTTSPSAAPTAVPTLAPSATPSLAPTHAPSMVPTLAPSAAPSVVPTPAPSVVPSLSPSHAPSVAPTTAPSAAPSMTPSQAPSQVPSVAPSASPSVSAAPSVAPTVAPSAAPSVVPSIAPSAHPTLVPSVTPTQTPSTVPSTAPSAAPSVIPTQTPSAAPSTAPSAAPSVMPSSEAPSLTPSLAPTIEPSIALSAAPTRRPTVRPTIQPTAPPTTSFDGIIIEQVVAIKFVRIGATQYGVITEAMRGVAVRLLGDAPADLMLNQDSNNALSSAAARVLGLQMSQVTVVDQTLIGEVNGVSRVRVTYRLLVQNSDFASLQITSPRDLFNKVTALFTGLINDGAYDTALNAAAAEYGAAELLAQSAVHDSTVQNPQPTYSEVDTYDPMDAGLSTGEYAGIVIGVLVAFMCLGCWFFFAVTRRNRDDDSEQQHEQHTAVSTSQV